MRKTYAVKKLKQIKIVRSKKSGKEENLKIKKNTGNLQYQHHTHRLLKINIKLLYIYNQINIVR